MERRLREIFVAIAALVSAGFPRALRAQQKMSSIDRERAETMLLVVRDEVKKHYYDSTFHGIDLNARYKEYEKRIDQAQSLGEAFTDIAGLLEALHDSHTNFIPPSRGERFDYGFRMELIGDQAYVTEVRPASDAATKLHPGDEILRLDRWAVDRNDFAALQYYRYQLAPQGGIALELRDPAGNERQELVKTRFIEGKRVLDLTMSDAGLDVYGMVREQEAEEHLLRQRWVVRNDVMIWKMPEFDLFDGEVDGMMDKARKCKALILDLRGNPGGSVKTLERMVGDVMDHDVTIAKRASRKPEKPQFAKTRGKDAFAGKVIVLVDSRSASASEIFARVIQLEHRGVVVGDRSAGAVMESEYYPEHEGADIQIFYGVTVTDANLIMSDGKRLEDVGVTPDVVVLPTAADLAAGRDPALSKAAELAGVSLDPAAAGKLFPFEWAPFKPE